MKARALFDAGKLDEAIASLNEEVRGNPADRQSRTFLFELLCFAGDYDRAEKQLDVLAKGSKEAEMGAWLYRGALEAERTRQEMFEDDDLPASGELPPPVPGTLNGEPFETLVDADPRIGARLEVFASGQYTWIPLRHVAAVRISEPERLRDLLWAPAVVRTAPSFRGVELGDVLLPATTPLAWRHDDPEIRLGRATDWTELADGEVAPVGHKLFLMEDEPVSLLEIRELEITHEDEAPEG